jgi:hypothetical protein
MLSFFTITCHRNEKVSHYLSCPLFYEGNSSGSDEGETLCIIIGKEIIQKMIY